MESVTKKTVWNKEIWKIQPLTYKTIEIIVTLVPKPLITQECMMYGNAKKWVFFDNKNYFVGSKNNNILSEINKSVKRYIHTKNKMTFRLIINPNKLDTTHRRMGRLCNFLDLTFLPNSQLHEIHYIIFYVFHSIFV